MSTHVPLDVDEYNIVNQSGRTSRDCEVSDPEAIGQWVEHRAADYLEKKRSQGLGYGTGRAGKRCTALFSTLRALVLTMNTLTESRAFMAGRKIWCWACATKKCRHHSSSATAECKIGFPFVTLYKSVSDARTRCRPCILQPDIFLALSRLNKGTFGRPPNLNLGLCVTIIRK